MATVGNLIEDAIKKCIQEEPEVAWKEEVKKMFFRASAM